MSWIVAKNGLTMSLFIMGANTYIVKVPALREEEESIVVKRKLFSGASALARQRSSNAKEIW